ncbi:lipocalin family protein [Mucilaginibacter panaciglaebae]|uniref:Lipocalin-like domain-containing protein n=1 Tax=Mucilaginibacter panaciglaebae TaxID=502331 RepID=A0ABP7WMZ8_9SPHI
MKKTLLTLLVAYTITTAAMFTSCTKLSEQPSQSQQILGKWTMQTAIDNYTTLGTNQKDTTAFTSADYFDFKADGTVSIMESTKAYNGKWKITNNKLVFTNTNYVDFDGGFNITTLTSTRLKIHYFQTDSTSTLDQILNFSK